MSSIHVSAVETPMQALRVCLEDVCELFNFYLVRRCNAGDTQKGLLIMDRSGREVRIREFMEEFDRKGTRHGYLGNIVDVPYFADSDHTRMLQLADLVAFAGGRYFNRNDRTYLDKVLPNVDRARKKGRMLGLKHIVGPGYQCQCIAVH